MQKDNPHPSQEENTALYKKNQEKAIKENRKKANTTQGRKEGKIARKNQFIGRGKKGP